MAGYDVTHLSALSLGIDPARPDVTPRGRQSGPYLSVGSVGNGISQILVSTQSVDAGGVTASRTTAVHLKLANAPANALVLATPWSGWSTAPLNALGIQSYMSTSAVA